MRRRRSILTLLLVLHLPTPCGAQSALMKRIKSVTEVPMWQRAPLNQKNLRKLLQDLQSPNKTTMRNAYEQLALSRPIPAQTSLVIGLTEKVAKQTRDKFATSMTFEIKSQWSDAKKAAETLQAAQRSGGLRYLEQVIARGTAAQAGGPLIAVAYSGNGRAAQVVVNYWYKTKIPGKKALLIIGPPAAPGLARQLSSGDYFIQKDIIDVLAKIGTTKEIPQLEKHAAKAKGNMPRQIAETIQEIEARAAASNKAKPKATP